MDKFCGKCGSKLDEKTGTCPRCGYSSSSNILDHNKYPDNTLSSKKKINRKGKKTHRTLIATILGIIILVAGVFSGLVFTDTIHISVMGNIFLKSTDIEECTEILENALSGHGDVNFINENGISIDTLSSGETAQKIMSLISFTIDGIQNEEDHTIAFVQFSVPDMIALSTEYVDNNNLDTDFLSWVRDRLNADYPTAEIDAQIRFINNNGNFSLVVDKELSNVLTGGALSYYLENEKAAYESLKGELEE